MLCCVDGSATDVMNAFYDVRVRFYDKRKDYLVAKLKNELEKLDNKVRFIQSVISGKLIISNRKKADLLNELKSSGYKTFVENWSVETTPEGVEETVSESDIDRGYNYLLGMKIWSLTQERVAMLASQREAKRLEIVELLTKSAEDLWLHDLDQLDLALTAFEGELDKARLQEIKAQNKAKADRGQVMRGKGKGKGYNSDEDDNFVDDDSDFSDYEARKKPKGKKTAKSAAGAIGGVNVKSTGVLIPRKITIEKERHVAVGSDGAVVPSKPKAKAVDRVAKPTAMDLEDVEEEVLTLAQRLAAKQNQQSVKPSAIVSSLQSIGTAANAKKAASTAATKKQPAPKKIVAKKAKKPSSDSEEDIDEDDLSEADSDYDFEPTSIIATSRAPRAAAAKVVFNVDSEEEEEEDMSDDEDLSEEDSDDQYSDDDAESEFEEPVRSKPNPKAVSVPQSKAKSAAVAAIPKITEYFGVKSAATGKASVSAVAKSVAPASPPQTKGAGVKRVVKKVSKRDDSEDEFNDGAMDAYSPSTPSPQAVKKAKKQTSIAATKVPPMASITTAAVKAPAAAKTATAKTSAKASTAKPAAAKASIAPKKKAKREESDDDDLDAEVLKVSKRSPLPSRARKPTNYNTYFDASGSEDDLVDSESDFDY